MQHRKNNEVIIKEAQKTKDNLALKKINEVTYIDFEMMVRYYSGNRFCFH